MNLKRLMNLFTSLILMMVLTSCAVSKDPVQNTNSNQGKENKEELEGKIIIWTEKNIGRNIKLSADKYKKENPKVQFEIVELKSDELNNKISNALKTKENLPNIVIMDSQATQITVKKSPDSFSNLSDEISSFRDKFLKYRIDNVTIDEKIYGFPYESKPIGIFFRKDIFDEAGIKSENIKTWDDFIDAGKVINTRTSGNIKLICFNENGDDLMYRQLMNQLGVFPFNKEGKPVVNSKESIKVISIMKKMHDSNVVYNMNGNDNVINLVKNNKVASVIESCTWTKELYDQCNDQKGKWALMRLPAFEPGGKTAASIGGSDLLVIKNPNNDKLVFKFAKFAVQDKESLINGFVNYGIYPAIKTCYIDEILEKPIEYFDWQRVWKLYYEIDRESSYVGYTENYLKVRDDIIKAQENILTKNATVNDVLFNLQKDFEIKLKK